MNWLRWTLVFTEREYFSLGVDMLTNSLKISNTTKKNFSSWFSSKVIKKDDKNYCHADWSAASDLLTCSLSISVLTWGFLGVSVTPLFAIYNFRNKWLLRIILFPKVFKVLWGFWKWRKKLENLFSFEDNCIWIGCVKHSLLLRERILVICCEYVKKQSQDFRYY